MSFSLHTDTLINQLSADMACPTVQTKSLAYIGPMPIFDQCSEMYVNRGIQSNIFYG